MRLRVTGTRVNIVILTRLAFAGKLHIRATRMDFGSSCLIFEHSVPTATLIKSENA
jgi:hypothetical protein